MILEVSQLHDLDGAQRLAEADRRLAHLPEGMPGKVTIEDVRECLRLHPRLSAEHGALRDDAMRCHAGRLKQLVGEAEITAGNHVKRRDALEKGLERHRAALAVNGVEEAAVEAMIGPGIVKRMANLRRAGDKEAEALAAVASEAAAVAEAAEKAAKKKRARELAAIAERRASKQMADEFGEGSHITAAAAESAVELIETAVALADAVVTLATRDVNEELRALVIARTNDIADTIAERALAKAWCEEVAEAIVEDTLEESFDEGVDAWADENAEVLVGDALEEATAAALVETVVAESFEEEKENWIERMAHDLVAEAMEEVQRDAEEESEARLYHARIMGVDPAELEDLEIDVRHPEMRAYLEQMRQMYGGGSQYDERYDGQYSPEGYERYEGAYDDGDGYEYEYQEGQYNQLYDGYYSGRAQGPGGYYHYRDDDPLNTTLGSIPEGENEGAESTLDSAMHSPTEDPSHGEAGEKSEGEFAGSPPGVRSGSDAGSLGSLGQEGEDARGEIEGFTEVDA